MVDRKKESRKKRFPDFTRYRIPVVSCKYLSHETFHDKSKSLKHTIHEGASRFPFTPLWEDRESQVRRRRLRPTAVSHSAFTSVSLAEERPQLTEAAQGRGSWKSKNSQPRAQHTALRIRYHAVLVQELNRLVHLKKYRNSRDCTV